MKNTLRVSLNAEKFPFLYRDATRATILPGLDVNARSQGFSGPESYDWGIPQLLYCENVMPIAKGLISTQFSRTIEPFGGTDFDQAIIVRDANENSTVLVPAGGLNYLLDITNGTWVSTLPFAFGESIITRAYVQGRSFVCYESEKLFEYDGPGNTLIDVTASVVLPAGVVWADIRGIGSASNYLLLFTDIGIHWSSPSDPLNFDVSLNNGSGYQIPQDVRGRISCILAVSGGAIIYTSKNAVALTYTNNAAVPFVFRGISNSGGVASHEQIAFDADERFQYVFGSGGLQQVSLQVAAPVYPECSDFLTSSLMERYNYTTHLVEKSQLGSYCSVKLTYVSQRFLVISYGETANAYEYALICDLALNRWGKVKIDHVDAFTYPYPNIFGDLTYAQLITDIAGLGDTTIAELGVGVINVSPPKKSIAFLHKDGTIDVLAIDYRLRSSSAVALIGQVQHNREYMTTLHQVELEGVQDEAAVFKLFDLMSLNGKTISEVREYLSYEDDGEYKRFLGDAVAKNHTLAVEGVFAMTGMILKVAKHGRSR